jgi:iron(III) transport system ATP-binding protein
MGSSNIIKGTALDETHLSAAGATLRCTGGKLTPGGEGAVAVRQHVMRIWQKKPQSEDNMLEGTVVRQAFLGASRDYVVEVADGTQLRVVASAAENIPKGAAVWLYLPPERCRVLSG